MTEEIYTEDIDADAAEWADGYEAMLELLAEDEEYARYLFELHHPVDA